MIVSTKCKQKGGEVSSSLELFHVIELSLWTAQ